VVLSGCKKRGLSVPDVVRCVGPWWCGAADGGSTSQQISGSKACACQVDRPKRLSVRTNFSFLHLVGIKRWISDVSHVAWCSKWDGQEQPPHMFILMAPLCRRPLAGRG
jgi:hypothetical protein